MALRGRLDGVFDGILRGWLWDPDEPLRRFTGEIWLDGHLLGLIRADRARADLDAIGFGEGGAGFEHPLPIEAQDGATHELRLVAEQQWLPIEVDRLSLPIPPRLHLLRGRVEAIAQARCSGWVWDAARPLDRVMVALLHEGCVLAQQPAAILRPELLRAGIGDSMHGFSFDLSRLQPSPAAGAALQLRSVGAHGEWLIGMATMQGAEAPRAAPTPPSPAPTGSLSPRQALLAARKAEAGQDHASAARLLDAALLEAPDDPDLLSTRARIHLTQQELELAERLARAVLGQHPGHERAMLMLARAVAALGRHAEAAEAWAAIGPNHPAFRERAVKRTRSLMQTGRRAEAQREMSLALGQHPDDPEFLRQLAVTADMVGAPRAALTHWRRVLARLPEDQAVRERVRALEHILRRPEREAAPSPLVNPDLRNWQGHLEAWAGPDFVWPAPGLRLRALAGRLLATPVAPRQLRPGELPAYGLLLRAEGGGGEVAFALAAVGPGWRMAVEVGAAMAGPPLPLVVALRRADGASATERVLIHLHAERGARLHRFDLALTEAEALTLASAGLELVVRIEGAGAILLQPPRALAALQEVVSDPTGFESAELSMAPPARPPREADGLAELATPFTSISIMAPPEALIATIQGVLGGTAAPFECVLTSMPDWPEALSAELHALEMRDPRFRLLPPAASAASGWVALVEAPPAGGPGWLTQLHLDAAPSGSAAVAGVLLARC